MNNEQKLELVSSVVGRTIDLIIAKDNIIKFNDNFDGVKGNVLEKIQNLQSDVLESQLRKRFGV